MRSPPSVKHSNCWSAGYTGVIGSYESIAVAVLYILTYMSKLLYCVTWEEHISISEVEGICILLCI